jgi:curli production assembly/transport component CsgE
MRKLNRYTCGVHARSILELGLTACLWLTVAGCVPGERHEGRGTVEGSEPSVRLGVSRSRQPASAVRQDAGGTLCLPQGRTPQLPQKEVPGTMKGPARTGAAPTPAQGPSHASAHKTVEEKIQGAIAEIQAGQKQTADTEKQIMEEITGLIVEETMTKIGYEFYEHFFLLWEPPPVKGKNYNILISERATPMWGSLVEVKVGETAVFGRMLRPRSEDIEESVKEAIAAAREYLENYEKQQLQTPDLMMSGI